jgi:hypothetical protein
LNCVLGRKSRAKWEVVGELRKPYRVRFRILQGCAAVDSRDNANPSVVWDEYVFRPCDFIRMSEFLTGNHTFTAFRATRQEMR